MTSKTAARALTYELGSSSYGDSKLVERKSLKRQSSSNLYAWFMYFSDMAKNGTIFSTK